MKKHTILQWEKKERTGSKEVQKKNGKLKYQEYQMQANRKIQEQPHQSQHQDSMKSPHSSSNKKGRQPMKACSQKRSTYQGDHSIMVKFVKDPTNQWSPNFMNAGVNQSKMIPREWRQLTSLSTNCKRTRTNEVAEKDLREKTPKKSWMHTHFYGASIIIKIIYISWYWNIIMISFKEKKTWTFLVEKGRKSCIANFLQKHSFFSSQFFLNIDNPWIWPYGIKSELTSFRPYLSWKNLYTELKMFWKCHS